jgi:DNA-directed RNA polymerase specialized sigma24 family protein
MDRVEGAEPDDDRRRHRQARDAALVAAVRHGDLAAFGRLHDQWFDAVFDVAARLVRRRDDALAVAGETFDVAWRRLPGLDPPEALGGWLLRLARNAALERDHTALPGVPDRPEVPVGAGAAAGGGRSPGATDPFTGIGPELPASGNLTSATAAADAADAQVETLVWAAAQTLTGRDLGLLDLTLRHGLAPGEAASALGLNPAAAAPLVAQLQDRLAVAVRAVALWNAGEPICDTLTNKLRRSRVEGFDVHAARLIDRHAPGCPTCRPLQELAVDPVVLFAAIPLAGAGPGERRAVVATLLRSGVPVQGSDHAGALGAPAPPGPVRPPPPEAATAPADDGPGADRTVPFSFAALGRYLDGGPPAPVEPAGADDGDGVAAGAGTKHEVGGEAAPGDRDGAPAPPEVFGSPLDELVAGRGEPAADEVVDVSTLPPPPRPTEPDEPAADEVVDVSTLPPPPRPTEGDGVGTVADRGEPAADEVVDVSALPPPPPPTEGDEVGTVAAPGSPLDELVAGRGEVVGDEVVDVSALPPPPWPLGPDDGDTVVALAGHERSRRLRAVLGPYAGFVAASVAIVLVATGLAALTRAGDDDDLTAGRLSTDAPVTTADRSSEAPPARTDHAPPSAPDDEAADAAGSAPGESAAPAHAGAVAPGPSAPPVPGVVPSPLGGRPVPPGPGPITPAPTAPNPTRPNPTTSPTTSPPPIPRVELWIDGGYSWQAPWPTGTGPILRWNVIDAPGARVRLLGPDGSVWSHDPGGEIRLCLVEDVSGCNPTAGRYSFVLAVQLADGTNLPWAAVELVVTAPPPIDPPPPG